jgi:outer membrane protein OmpA-like peptidoglycan-associated protein
MQFRVIFTSFVAAVALMGCADMATVKPSPRFSNELGKQYTSLSIDNTASAYKGMKTEYFTKKGQQAYAGVDVQPEDPTTWNVPTEYRPELKNAYDMLQIALVPDRKKVEKPVAAADAQAYFDCWIDQAHQHWVPNSHENDCRAAYYAAFCHMYNGKCSAAIDSDHIFRIYFNMGKNEVDEKGREQISKVAATFNKGGNEVIVAGHADKVGNSSANMALSKARAYAVRDKLILAGIPAKRITVKAFGENMPLVPTAKDVPNASNRRVLIVVR